MNESDFDPKDLEMARKAIRIFRSGNGDMILAFKRSDEWILWAEHAVKDWDEFNRLASFVEAELGPRKQEPSKPLFEQQCDAVFGPKK